MKAAERVHAVVDYWDGPRLGVADFAGEPHAFRCIFDDAAQDYTELFRLKRLTADEFDIFMRDWAIWLHWKATFDAGLTSIDTHPALPEDHNEHITLAEAVSAALLVPPDAFIARGSFKTDRDTGEMQVRWSRLRPSVPPRSG